ncbi:MAG: serine/threonine protein kinase [Acidobacteriota bacterium]|nr:serine/threonine protein kinase [Acidobacteriota bacterium]
MLGRTVSHYHITSQLGEGGMGVVYEAEDTNLGRHVALKFLTPAMAGDESLLQRFQREARAASSLNHPNICTIHGIEQFESEHFIVMELLDGESLADRIRRGTLDIDSVLTLGVQIVDALESAHSKGIVHHDLKPANIFVTSAVRQRSSTSASPRLPRWIARPWAPRLIPSCRQQCSRST